LMREIMKRSTKNRAQHGRRLHSLPAIFCRTIAPLIYGVALIALTSCGGGSGLQPSQGSGQLAGNWQFTMTAPSDNSFLGGLQGGFLLQNNQSLSGQVTYAIYLPPASSGAAPTLCNSGTAPVTGNINGGTVTLTAVAGPQTFTLSGTLSTSGTTLMGTYSSSANKGCGTAQSGVQWSAVSVPSLTGTIQGFFHSGSAGSSDPTLKNQLFPVTGTLTQGQNIGASNATVTGTLNFTGYPCLSSVSVNGQVSGSSAVLQLIGSNGLSAGQIGAPTGFSNPGPVSILSSAAGLVLQGTNAYGVSSSSCPASTSIAGDVGDICLGVGNTTTCTQPILLSPATLAFPAQQVGTAATTQIITLTNNNLSSAPLSGLTLSFNPQAEAPSSLFSGPSDFTGLPNFTEQDTCASSLGKAFNLAPQQSCTITIGFSPQESCPWLPSTALSGEPPSKCPFSLAATLSVNSPSNPDGNSVFTMPISGIGFSAIIPSTPELDFGNEAVGESSAPQVLSLINQGANPVQILPALSTPCVNPAQGQLPLPRPILSGEISGLQVDQGNLGADNGVSPATILYNCDSDLTSELPNFQISQDGCSGTLLIPQSSCSLTITFVPQPSTSLVSGLDYFLELNTLECTSAVTANCEIDSGRFPVELKANSTSPLRMTPTAGLAFGNVPAGQTSSPLTVTVFNDPKAPNPGTVTFNGNVLQGTSFAETDTCAGSLAPGSSCTFTITFTPLKGGGVFTSGTITISYTMGQITQTQFIYLRGTGE
jgi:hypothetical protein